MVFLIDVYGQEPHDASPPRGRKETDQSKPAPTHPELPGGREVPPCTCTAYIKETPRSALAGSPR